MTLFTPPSTLPSLHNGPLVPITTQNLMDFQYCTNCKDWACQIKVVAGINSILLCENKELKLYRWQLFNKAFSPSPSLPGLNFISLCPGASHLFSFQSLFPLLLPGCASSKPHPSTHSTEFTSHHICAKHGANTENTKM